MHTPRAWIMVSKSHSPIKGSRTPWLALERKYKMCLEHLLRSGNKKILKKYKIKNHGAFKRIQKSTGKCFPMAKAGAI